MVVLELIRVRVCVNVDPCGVRFLQYMIMWRAAGKVLCRPENKFMKTREEGKVTKLAREVSKKQLATHS